MDSPEVTVGIFSHNHSAYIQDCVNYLVVACNSPCNVIFIDDASSDSTPSQIRYAQTYLEDRGWNTQVFLGETNKYFPARLNQFLEMIDTEWFLVHSADDFLLPGAIDKLLKTARYFPNVDIVFGRILTVDLAGNPLPRPRRARMMMSKIGQIYSKPQYPFRDLLKYGNFIPGGLTLIRRVPAIGNVPLYRSMRNAEDFDWYLRLGRKSLALMVNSEVGCWRVVPNSKSRAAGREYTESLLDIMNEQLRDAHPSDVKFIQDAAIRYWIRPFVCRDFKRCVGWRSLKSLPTITGLVVLRRLPVILIREIMLLTSIYGGSRYTRSTVQAISSDE